jgi:hypothetical protein
MKKFSKILIVSAVLFAVIQPIFADVAYAQFTILPQAANPDQCDTLLKANNADVIDGMLKTAMKNEVLGCAVKTGRISLSMIPYYITYFANFLLSLSGVITMLFIVLGGYWYVFGGLMEQKERGKKYITHALMGMVIAILSWVIVTVVINVVTS